jgi:hypothetical protein
MGNLKLIYENILLTESRVSKARDRYPEISQEVFDIVVQNDPSGNQKYLDWILSEITTTEDKDNLTDVNGVFLNTHLLPTIKFFHENLHLYDVKDINFYKSLSHLVEVTSYVKEKKSDIDRKKLAKKQKTVVYNDDNFLVISPKSWEASCEYGSGTKWCVAGKQGQTHWDNYSKNATFFYIINKNLPDTDPLYKVAYRRMGSKDRFELWDALDIEFSTTDRGSTYLSSLPKGLLNNSEDYHRLFYPEIEGDEIPDEILEDPKMLALYNLFGDTDIEENNYRHYGLDVYAVGSEGDFAVGTDEEADDAQEEYWENFAGDVGIDGVYGFENYLEMRDEEGFIDSEVDSYIYDLGDNELLSIADLEDDYETIDDEIYELENEVDDLEITIIELDDETEADEIDTINSEIEVLQNKIKDLENKKNDLIDEARGYVEDIERDEWRSCLRDGVYDCFVKQRGWFGSAQELLNSGLVDFDNDEFVSDMIVNSDRGTDLATYDGVEQEMTNDDGTTYYIFKI